MLVVVLALFLCGLGWWLTRPGAGGAGRTEVVAPVERHAPLPEAETALDREVAQSGSTRIDVPASAPVAVEMPLGAISVRLFGPDGQPFEGAWTIVVEDMARAAARLSGAIRVTSSSLKSSRGPTTVMWAPLGVDHALCARAAGLASPTVRCHFDAKQRRVEVDLTLEPATEVEGRVVDELGQGVDGMLVTFVPRFAAAGYQGPVPVAAAAPLSIETATDASGAFRSPPLQSVRWNVLVGPADNPITRVNDVALDGPRVQLPPITLPRLHTLVVRVVDSFGRRVPGALVASRGEKGGVIEGLTDANGELACDNLPAGRWRVHASVPDLRRTNRVVEVPAERVVELRLGVRSPR